MAQDSLSTVPVVEGMAGAPASVLRFSPGQVAMGYAPVIPPAPLVWSTYPRFVKVLGWYLLFISFPLLYLTAAGWENALIQDHARWIRFEYGHAAIVYTICTTMCLWGARGLIVRDDPDRGFVATLCLIGTALSYPNLWDVGLIYLPGGVCGAFFFVVAIMFPFMVMLHIVRRRRARIAKAERAWRYRGPIHGRP